MNDSTKPRSHDTEEAEKETTVSSLKERTGEQEVEDAVRTLIRWAGEDPGREGLLDTPSRVAKAWREFFKGYSEDPKPLLERTFGDINEYDGPIILTDIDFQSHCEHHLAPIIGRIHIGYLPDKRVIGLSKMVRLCEIYTRRMQTQEKMTAQIAQMLQDGLKPRGVAICVEAQHYCMISRGVRSFNTSTLTRMFMGAYRDDSQLRQEFVQQVGCRSPDSE